MRHCVCDECGDSVPMNESFSVPGRNLCGTCGEAACSVPEGVPKEHCRRNIDPTMCSNCGADAGDRELPLLALLPVCETCEAFFRNRPFPVWVKAASAMLVVIVGFALFWNSRFILAYVELKAMNSAIDVGTLVDVEKIDALMTTVANRIPEAPVIKTLQNYWHGMALMSQDKSREALACFKKCGDSSDFAKTQVDELIRNAELAVAFDDGNYDEFLRLALNDAKVSPNDPFALGTVASAYACKFAKEGKEEFRQQSLEYLDRARALEPGPQFETYKMRIQHRLNAREVITASEFRKRFPNGWHPEEEKQP